MVKKKAVVKEKRREKLFLFIILIIAVALVLFFLFQQGIIELPAPPAIPISDCGELNETGAYYSLLRNINVADLAVCFLITAEDITFDGNNFALTGDGTGDAVNVGSYNNAQIINLEISNFQNGIYFDDNSRGNSVENVNSHDNALKNIRYPYDMEIKVKTMKEDYFSEEDVELTDASEIPQ